YVMVFASLAPNELIGFELLAVNGKLPELITARSDQCMASMVDMYAQPIVQPWKRRLAVLLIFMGFSFSIYLAINLLQFLVLSTVNL
ncbi:MAG: hypothetical protein OXE99_02830, partial [Cellvibrionales bacterium]|nr:hypothetical protein [Cellvibrionales bacterium]